MIRNKNKLAKPPKPRIPDPQNPGRLACQKKQKRRKMKPPKDWRTNQAKLETTPEFFQIV